MQKKSTNAATAAPPLVYIVTLNWNGYDDTVECVKSLHNITYKNYKIVIIDNGSNNEEGLKLQKTFPKDNVIRLKNNTGFTGGCNAGINYALSKKADYILLLNNDTVVKERFLTTLIEYMSKTPEVGITSPKILYYNSNKIWSMGGTISMLTGIPRMIGKNQLSGKYTQIIEPDFLTGCAMLFSRETIKTIGIFDNNYFAYYEDVDLSFKARNAGFKLKVIPESIVYHKKSASAGVIGSNKLTPLQAFLRGRNGILFAKNNLSGVTQVSYSLGHIFLNLIYTIINSQNANTVTQYLRGLKAGFSL